MYELVVVVLQQPERLGIELERGALLVDRGYAREELRVEEDEVLVGSEFGGLNGFDVLEGGVGVCLGDSIEGCHNAFEQPAALLHGDDGVVKTGNIGIVGDDLDFGLLLRHAGLDRGLEIFILDFVERRSLERQCTGREEGVRGAKVRGCGQCGFDGIERDGSGNDQGT